MNRYFSPETIRGVVQGDRPRAGTRLARVVMALTATAALGVSSCSLASNGEPGAVSLPPTLSVTADGPLTWQQVELPRSWSPEFVVDGSAGLLVMASRDDRPDRWADVFAINPDDGIDWTVLESGGFSNAVHIDGLVGADSGYFAYGLFAGGEVTVTTVGRPSNFPEPAVWTSIDGVVWELTPLPLPRPAERISEIASYSVFYLAVSGDLRVAVGTEFDEDLPDGRDVVVPTRQVIWATTESGDWGIIDDERLSQAEGAAAGPSGIITTTQTADGGIDVWNTNDGAVWEQLGVIPQDGRVAVLEGSGVGYVALVAGPDRERHLWFSETGATWSPVEGIDRAGWVYASSQGFVVDAAETVYWSPDGETWRPVSAPDGMAYIGRAAASARSVILTGQTHDGSGRLFIGTEPD